MAIEVVSGVCRSVRGRNMAIEVFSGVCTPKGP